MRNSTLKYLVAAAVVASIAGCECERGQNPERRFGEIGLVYEIDGTQKTGTDAIYDFGAVFMGQEQSLKMTVKNVGAGMLGLSTLEKESGDAVALGSFSEPNPVFDVAFEARELGASEVTEYEMTFRPPQNEVERVVEHEAHIILRATNTRDGLEAARITLKGRAVSGVCELPKVLDFGAVARNDSYKITVDIKNPTQLEATASVGDIYSTSGDHLAFKFTPDSPRGTFPVAVNSTRTVSITFTPTESKSYLAFVKMRASAQCPEFVVQLVGSGVDSVLSWDPKELDFGYVTPGLTVTRDLTFTNRGNADATVSTFVVNPAGEYQVEGTTLAVPGKNGTATLRLSFTPAVLGPRLANFNFKTSLPKQPTGAVALKGFGGGPDIDVRPHPVLNFGRIAYFAPPEQPVFQTRKLTVMNAGTKPTPPDPKANLKLGAGGAGAPYFDWVPLNANTTKAELDIPMPAATGANSYNPTVGLEASAGKNLLDLILKVTPASVGLKEWEVTIWSNDPDEPEVKVKVTADAVVLPPCNYSVTPTALNFGLVTPPQYRELSFTVTNLGTGTGDICLLSSLDLAVGSDPIFTLPGGPVASKELQPGESYVVSARAWPQGSPPTNITNATGAVEFFMSSPTQPQKLVQLEAAIALGCLSIQPDDVTFGTVKVGCGSATKSFNIYNTCTTAVTINGITLQSAAGQPAGGPNCSGTNPCPEFHFVSVPAPPWPKVHAAGASPLSFSLKYIPIDLGSDTGAVAINAVQNGQNVTYIVTLSGTGDTVGLNTDVFTQDAKPKADILLVIDTSCSMDAEQQLLASNFDSFIKYAVAAGVDYHIGVTTTNMDVSSSGTCSTGPNCGGRLVGTATNPKVLTPNVPDVQAKFKQKVELGTDSSATEKCFEPALAALTAPLITTDNAGFLRNEASLAIVCVTDEIEQSPQSVQYYYNALLNIKGVRRSNMLTVNAIAGFPPLTGTGCNAYADDGRYNQMVTLTNGVKDSICTPDWSKTLENLGKISMGFRTNFFLSGTPDLTGGREITVQIDGTTIPATDPRGSLIWTYDQVANSVNFEPMYVPEPGQSMTITYHVSCFSTTP